MSPDRSGDHEPEGRMFVAGLGRSGTTALMRVLMAHPQIVLGCERYKNLWATRPGAITDDLFTRERFFDFSDGLTNLTPADPLYAEQYDAMAAKWDTAAYAGDKMTEIRMGELWANVPTARFVCIVRDAADTAYSWDVRARDPDDRWPERLGARASVKRWNTALWRILKARQQRPADVVVVEYASVFGPSGSESLDRVLAFLGLPSEPLVEAALAEHQREFAGSVRGKDRSLDPGDQAFVDLHADRELWREVTAVAP